MALIGEYQRSPQFIAGGAPGDDATSASYTELPASYKPPPRRPAQARGSGWRRWVRTHLTWAGWASVGAALVVVGVILGAALSSSSTPTPKQASGPGQLPPIPPPPKTVCGSSGRAAGGPGVCMVGHSQGYASTAFVVQGSGFAPRTSLKVHVSEIDPNDKQIFSVTSPDMPVTGPDGTFRVPVRQLYSGSLELGLVTVDVTGPDGTATTQFMILPPGVPITG
jgi:hypothetical protein